MNRAALLFSLLLVSVPGVSQVKPFDYRGDTQPQPATVAVTLTAGKYEITQQNSGDELVRMETFGFLTQPRNPMLPMKVFEVAVPPNVDWKTLKLQTTIEGRQMLPGKHRVSAVPVQRPLQGPGAADAPQQESERNQAVYGANAVFPAEPVSIIAQSQMRKWRFVRLAFVPIRYNPVDGSLELIQAVRVKLDMSRIGKQTFRTDPLLLDTRMDEEAEQRFINFKEAKEWYAPAGGGPLAAYDYSIITTNAIQSGSTALASFIAHKQSQGHTVRVVTESDYDGLTGQAPNGKAEKIRQWLIDNYATLGIKWVLLIGNPNPGTGDVPMKMAWPRFAPSSYTQYRESPTDYFYADLTGNWDLDGDGNYGENECDHPDTGAGGVDFTPETYVGRIPVYGSDLTALDQILSKIIGYETSSSIPHWRRHALFGMAYLWDPCSDWQLGESIISDYATKLGMQAYRHYEENTTASPEASPVIGHSPTYPPHPPDCSPGAPDNMLKEWANTNANEGYGMVVWSTHGSDTGASGLMTTAVTTCLDNDQPSFVFQGSCLNGYPETTNNLGYELLKTGAIGTVSASRVSWSYCFGGVANPHSGANCQLSYHYNRRLASGYAAGRALYDTKSEVDAAGDWMNKFDFNLYGDPTTALLTPYRVADIDIIPVLDHSGSMSDYASTSMTDRKIEALRDATHQVVDMMDASGANQFGLVQFTTAADTLMNLQSLTPASRATAHTTVNGITATNLTSIGDGLQHAVTEFTSHGSAGHRRVILLVTDGMENTAPMIAGVQPSVVAGGITVFPVGLGYSYGIDEARLIALANATGGDYRVTDDDLLLKKYFIEILGSATDWSVVTDPVFALAAGQSDSVAVPVAASDTSVLFTAYWAGIDNGIHLTLQAPDGTVYNATSPSYLGAKRYAIYKVELGGLPASQRTGTWTMRVEADKAAVASNTVRVSVSALAKSDTRISPGVDRAAILAGDSARLQVRLTRDGRPISGASVVVHYEKPLAAFGNVMHDNPVTPSQFRPRGDRKSLVALKAEYLREKLGKKFMPRADGEFRLYDDGTHGDAAAGDGLYTGTFTDTKVPGTYTLRFAASNVKIGDGAVSRERTQYLHVTVGARPEASDLEVRPIRKVWGGSRYAVKVIPRDGLGNYLGPGHKVSLTPVRARAEADKTNLKRPLELRDNLDGSYTGELVLKRGEPKVEVAINGQSFTVIAPRND